VNTTVNGLATSFSTDTDTASLRVNVEPTIVAASTVNANENQIAVIDVNATDPNGDTEGGGLVYSFSANEGGADNGSFLLAADGVITFSGAPDFEASGSADEDNVYEVQVTVTDSGTSGTEPLTATQNIAVTVVNVNEAPSVTAGASATVAENQTGTTIDASSSDPESETDNGGGLAYSLAGADAARFSVDSGTGVLTFASAPNYEVPGDAGGDNVYNVQIVITDSGALTGTTDVAVTVTNVNEAPIMIVGPLNVDEDSTTVNGTQPSASDVDANDGETWTLVAGGAGLFTVDSGTGAVTAVGPFDYETTTSYTLTIKVADTVGASVQADVTVNINDIAEDPVLAAISNPTVAENQTGTTIDASATDPQGDTGLVFSLTGADAGALSIDSSTGVVTFNAAPDFETKTSYSINVVVTDPQGNSDSQAVTITISDVAEGSAATIYSAVDNSHTVYVNGVEVDSGADWGTTSSWSGTLAPGDVVLVNAIDWDAGNGGALLRVEHDGNTYNSGTGNWTVSLTETGTYGPVNVLTFWSEAGGTWGGSPTTGGWTTADSWMWSADQAGHDDIWFKFVVPGGAG
ncbi:MAG: cadherin repeat domain-containing protein, partial [Acidimicrobiales bacterium]